MSETNKLPKFKLARKPDEAIKTAKLESDRQAEPQKPKPSLILQETETVKRYVSSETDELCVKSILADAYNPEKERARRARLNKKYTVFTLVIGLFLLSVLLTYGYAYVWNQWDTLEPITWYVPFILSVALSVAALVKSYQIWTSRHRSYSLTVTAICIAAGLTYWNVTVLDTATQTANYTAGIGLWEPKNTVEMLIVYEINHCRGISPLVYTAGSIDSYKKGFRSLPNPEWKAYFKVHLNSDELGSVTSINIDEKMRQVAARMQSLRVQRWADFEVIYQDSPFLFKLKKWALTPYTLILSRL